MDAAILMIEGEESCAEDEGCIWTFRGWGADAAGERFQFVTEIAHVAPFKGNIWHVALILQLAGGMVIGEELENRSGDGQLGRPAVASNLDFLSRRIVGCKIAARSAKPPMNDQRDSPGTSILLSSQKAGCVPRKRCTNTSSALALHEIVELLASYLVVSKGKSLRRGMPSMIRPPPGAQVGTALPMGRIHRRGS